jgi:membrane peptidoglycan carboxypeptidase
MSATKTKASGALGAILGIVGMSAVAGILATAMVAPALAVTGVAANNSISMFESLPSYLKPDALAQKSQIFAVDGTGAPVLLASVFDQNREEVSWDQISPFAKDAVISVEDPRFYSHGGVDLLSSTRAALQSAVSSGGPGASTISMQYVRNILIQNTNAISDPVLRQAAFEDATKTTVDRKLKEMKYAIGLEKEYTKDEILLGYLNISNFGGTVYGIQAAARYYFNVSAADLSIAQAASLIAMVNYPNGLRIDQEENIPDNKARRDLDILPAMLKENKITKAQYDEALATPVTPVITAPSTGCQTANPVGGSYFCDYVSYIIKTDPSFGDTADARWEKFKTGGFKIYTTLDIDLQVAAIEAMDKYVPQTSDKLNIGSSMVTVQPGTGKVLAMVQNKTFNADPDTTQPNQTAINYSTDYAAGGSAGFPSGSTYKVFTLADWLKNGHALGERVNGNVQTFDLATFKNSCQGGYSGPYKSANDGGSNPGAVTVSQATASSINNAFIAMAQKLDMCEITKTAEDFGMHRADGNPLTQVVSSVLGINEVAPLTVAAAYAGIAAGGLYCSPVAIDKIIDSSGAELAVPKSTCTQAVDSNVAAAMAQAMAGVINGGTGSASNPNDGIPHIGKTGTTDGENHTWMAGASTKLATVIWVGNVVGSVSLRYTSVDSNGGTNNAASLRHLVWRQYMTAADAKYGGDAFGTPTSDLVNGVQVAVPDVRGMTVLAAKTLIESLGFTYADGGVVDSDVPAGQAAGSDPAAGSTVTKGSIVTVTTSNAALSAVPNFVGQKVAAITAAGWAVGSTSVAPTATATCVDGTAIVSTNPAAGTLAKKADQKISYVTCKPVVAGAPG